MPWYSGLPDPQEAILAECRQEVLMGMVRQSNDILFVDLKIGLHFDVNFRKLLNSH